MEILIAILEAVAGVADVTCFVADIYAWFRGRENRVARREARRAGEVVPPRDRWSWWVIVLTTSVMVLTAYLLTR